MKVLLLVLAPVAIFADSAFFEREVRPILIERCYECHSAEGKTKGGLRLDTRDRTRQGGDSGAALIPGKPEESLLIEAIGYSKHDLQMPPKNPLPPDEVAALRKWIEMGAPDPREDSAGAAKSSGMSLADGREFWAFKPVKRPAVPKVRDPWVRTPIDAFALADLRAKGEAPPPVSSKRELIRRVNYDLIGLPPTPAEIADFLADDTPDAFARVVDRLLASPQYGVRWGRHWLDVARYADSNGLDENLAFGQAWRYRDYVVDSFNADKPFDQFLVEQIAGDLLPQASAETRTATGLLALGARVLAEKDLEKLRMDVIDEQIDTLGKAFLGMTFGCARCHEHKFDPITQADYYGLAAIFKSSESFARSKTGEIKNWYEHSLATDAERERQDATDEELASRKKAVNSFKTKAIVKLRGQARKRATDYLLAATRIEFGASLSEVRKVAEPLGLHPRVLHHCRIHLEYHKDEPAFSPWHKLRQEVGALADFYHKRFAAADSANKADPFSVALHDNSGFLAVPAKPSHALDAETYAEYQRLTADLREYESSAYDAPAAMGIADGEICQTVPLHIRGSHLNLGAPIARAFPEVMRRSQAALPPTQSGRLELARWMASGEHPLTARVYVNRLWRWHFGEGLVATTENFGVLGARPSNPQLLDWLAQEFMAGGWRTKAMHRLILNSSTYQARGRLLRLEAEQIRDAILATAGSLDSRLGGKTIPLRNRQMVFNHTSEDHTSYSSYRRSLYLPIVRNHIADIFQQFDYPDPTMPTGNRQSTTVAPQALLLLNSDLVGDAAAEFANRLLREAETDESRIRLAYETAFARLPTAAESARAQAFLSELPADEAWPLLAQSLYASNEFVYLR
jgi:hypothetical protein